MNKKLYEEIKKRLKAHDGKGDKAFAEPLYHPSIKSHPIVSRVKIREHSASGSGIPVRGGIAENGGMIRVDVFCKEGKYFLVPIYVHHRLSDTLPDRAIVSGKPEGEWVRMDSSYQFLFSLLTMMWWSLSVKRIASRSKVIT